MKLNAIKTSLLVAAIGMSGAANSAILFDANGAAPGGNTVLTTMDWEPGNVLFQGIIPIPAAPTTVTGTLLYQAAITTASYLDAGSELTIQASIPVEVTVAGTVLGTDIALDSVLAGGTINIFYDAAGDANDITGAGYDNGTNILSGTVQTGVDGAINIGPSIVGLLDQFGADNQGGVTTHQVTGGINNMLVAIDSFDANFFLPDINGDTVDVAGDNDLALTIDNVAAFFNANPSDAVVGAAPDYGSDGVNNNTCPTPTTCDLHAEADGRSPFFADQKIPEPATVALLGLGLAGIGFMRRRNKA